jgi:hypothetical protein
MKTATQTLKELRDDDMRRNLRLERAQTLTALVLSAITPHLRTLQDHRAERDIVDALGKLFYEGGFEAIGDATRERCGLPQRDHMGWTPHELVCLEQHRLELLMRPLNIVIPMGEKA